MARAASTRTDRRDLISRALYSCIIEQGYANTTLKDIADRADMTPSHVGYYFDDQAAILVHYTRGLCERIVAGFPTLDPDRSPDRLIDDVVTFCFGEGQPNTEFLGVVQELSGLAVHDEALREIKSQHTQHWQRFLQTLFDTISPVAGLDARDASRIAHALLAGLDTNTVFDPTLARSTAQRLFRDTLRTLAGLDALPRTH
ncbi:MAG: TetR/AcrR family transcriptional regulator [Ilumatobacter sp.]|uniref:TetR/AcrR family transcriptional regulator n=1 Tax=Ilumatobacter sp. TaxID=1967498 RepID=UPI003C74AC48